MNKTSLHTRRIVLSALFLAIALVLRTFFRIEVPIFGESGMRLSVHGIFSIMPSILFGPFYGAMVSGLTDMAGHFLRPTGAWLPQLTVSAAAGGFIRGWIWIFLKKSSTKTLRTVLITAGVLLITAGGYHMYALRADGVTRDFYQNMTDSFQIEDTASMRQISRFAVTRTFNSSTRDAALNEYIIITTWTMAGLGMLLLLLMLLDIAVRKALDKYKPLPHTLALILAMMIPAILVSTFNTYVFRQTIFTSWQLLPFAAVWLPRVLQSIGTTSMNVFFVVMLIGLCEKQPHIKHFLQK